MPPPCVPDPLDHQNTNFNSSAPTDRKNAHLENYTEKTELDLPSFHHFSNNIWRHADLVVRDKNDQPVYLHKCILASKTNRFSQLTDDTVLTGKLKKQKQINFYIDVFKNHLVII